MKSVAVFCLVLAIVCCGGCKKPDANKGTNTHIIINKKADEGGYNPFNPLHQLNPANRFHPLYRISPWRSRW